MCRQVRHLQSARLHHHLYNVTELLCSCDLIMILDATATPQNIQLVAQSLSMCSADEPKRNNAVQRGHAHRANCSHRAAEWGERKQVHCILTMMGVP